MAKVFLDTNVFIDLVEQRGDAFLEHFYEERIYISALSVHILFYVTKRKVPYEKLDRIIRKFTIIDVNELILAKALEGPMSDFEDNVQLHSAAEEECDIFLTRDKELLKRIFFGKVKLASEL